jgi:hypothetical protein
MGLIDFARKSIHDLLKARFEGPRALRIAADQVVGLSGIAERLVQLVSSIGGPDQLVVPDPDRSDAPLERCERTPGRRCPGEAAQERVGVVVLRHDCAPLGCEAREQVHTRHAGVELSNPRRRGDGGEHVGELNRVTAHPAPWLATGLPNQEGNPQRRVVEGERVALMAVLAEVLPVVAGEDDQ